MDNGKFKMASWVARFFVALALLTTNHYPLTIAQQRDIEAQNAVKLRAQERLAEIERQSKELSGDISTSEQSLRVARSTIAAKRKVAADLDRETKRITVEMNAATRETERLASDLTTLRRDYGRMVYLAWKNHETNNAALLLLSSKDFNDAAQRIYFIRRYNRAREERGAQIDSMNNSLQVELERLAVKKTEIAGLRAESDRLLSSLAGEEARYETTLRSLGNDRKQLQAQERQEREKIAAAQREINRIMARQSQAASSTTLTEAEIALSGQFGDNKGKLPWPTGAPGLILHHYGKERSSDGIESEFKGLIIAARPSSEVKSVFEGTVTLITDLGQYDKCVMVRSGEYVVGYGNISVPTVKSGDKVSLNQSLGTLNSSDDPDRHLVLVWMQRGNTVLDPEEWLR
jgi:septal ring factor EnvC (AmiA/AmiB activator)